MDRWYFLACMILIPCLVSGESLKYGLHGNMLHLNPQIPAQPDRILWTYNGNKMVEFDGSQQEAFIQFKNRVTLDWITAELNITGLRYDDSGDYVLEAIIQKNIQLYRFKVLVIDRISKPIISCDINNGSSGTQATLTCSADSQASVTYEWDLGAKTQQGPKLTISLGEEHDDQVHTCIVSNPLNSENATFTAKDCHPAKTSPLVLGAAIGGVFIGSVLVLSVVLGLCCLKQKKKEVKRKDIEACEVEERKILIDRTPTIPSNQQLHNLNKDHGNVKMGHPEEGEMEKGEDSGCVKDIVKKFEAKAEEALSPTTKKPTVYPLSKDNDDAEADEHIREPPENTVPEPEPSGAKKANEPELAGGSDHGEDTEAAPEHPEEHLNKDKTTCSHSPPPKPARLNPINQPVNNNDEEQDESGAPQENKVPKCKPADTERADEPEPASGSHTQTDEESPAAPQQAKANEVKRARPPTAKKPIFHPPSKNKDDAEADEHTSKPPENMVPESEPSDAKKANEPEPAVGSDHREDTEAEVESSTALQQEKHLDKDKETCPSPPPNKSSHLDSLNQPELSNENAEKDESTGPSENKVSECEPSDTEAGVEFTALQTLGYVRRVSRKFDTQAGLGKEHQTTVSQHSSEKVMGCEPSDTEKENLPDPVGLDNREDAQAKVESPTAPEHPESDDKSHPANGTPPVPKPRSRSTNSSPDVGTKDTTGAHKEGTQSHPVRGETSEND